jgi:hypothetical protein
MGSTSFFRGTGYERKPILSGQSVELLSNHGLASEHPLVGLEPTSGIAKRAIRDCMNRDHQRQREYMTSRHEGLRPRILCKKRLGNYHD